MLNLDTHILLHAFHGTLTDREQAILASDEWSVSPVVFWEIVLLKRSGKIDDDLSDPELLDQLASLHVWPSTFEVARSILELDFRSDPADALIAATSIAHGVPLVTRDAKLRQSRLVPLAM